MFIHCGCSQEQYFAVLPEMMSEGDENYGWDEFVKQSWKFKHDRIAVEKRGSVRTADVARLMEVFQVSARFVLFIEFSILSLNRGEMI